MKVNELRIGNLVFEENGVFEPVIKRLTAKDIYDFDSDMTESKEQVKYFKPIPINEEWLLKFGFEKKIINDEIEYKKPLGKYSDLLILSDYSFSVVDSKLLSPKKEVQVVFENDMLKSIHRLQNLYFALTGEELTTKSGLSTEWIDGKPNLANL